MTLLSGFNQHCQHSPNATALIEGERQLSYGQLLKNSQLLAAAIQQRLALLTLTEQQPGVALLLERGIDAATAIYGILMTGAIYIPLDSQNPVNRLRFIIQDAQPALILGKGNCPAWLESSEKWLAIDTLPTALPYTALPLPANALAAILYTSGSTGTPKGVALSRHALSHFSTWAADTFALTAADKIANLAPFHFDLSIFDLFSSLSRGACVVFMPSTLTFSPSRLTAWLSEHAITCWYTVPSILRFIALKGALANTPLPFLKTLLFAGEVFPTPHLILLAEHLPQVNLYNLFGPTETNVCCYWPVERARLNPQEPIPIGKPAGGAELKLNEETGELWVRSDTNFAGYWQQGTLRKPHTTDHWYATGDKVSRNAYGEYCYHGRLDRLLKCSGYRIEPAEIEQVINQLPAIAACAVVGIEDAISGKRPAAAVVLNPGFELAECIKPLKEKLPAYMQPCKFLVLEKLPLLSNGKIDFQALSQLF